jgi:hypothetical protein
LDNLRSTNRGIPGENGNDRAIAALTEFCHQSGKKPSFLGERASAAKGGFEPILTDAAACPDVRLP